MKNFTDFNISIPIGSSGEVRVICPECTPTRRNQKERDLSVNVEKGAWHCHHCGWGGSLGGDKSREEVRSYFRPVHNHVDLPQQWIDYLVGRGISQITARDNGLSLGTNNRLKFPYFKNGVVVNAKYRTLDKHFSQEKNAEACLYRFDQISGCEEIIICEGEFDALACYEAGFKNATSVPNGAPAPNAKNYTKEFSYLDSAKQVLESVKKVILAVDNDQPGKVLEQELARRIGVEKCWRVNLPSSCKDVNDVLVKYGRKGLRDVIDNAKPYPVEGIFRASEISDLILHLYDQGFRRGVSTGWNNLDQLYTVKTGQMSIVTGIPGSGKSNFIDALMVNLVRYHQWSFAVFSPENWPLERHAQSLIEKMYGAPFDRDCPTRRRMKREDVQECIGVIDSKFHFIMPEEDAMTVDAVLDKARVSILRFGVKGIVIDPWNELDHDFGAMTETQYISVMLGKIRRFARRNDVHVWIVAHPQKLIKDKDSGKYRPPTMYEINGGAHWRNKADVGLCVHRPDTSNDITQVIVQKIRFREVGKLGQISLRYCRDTGSYSEHGETIQKSYCDTTF